MINQKTKKMVITKELLFKTEEVMQNHHRLIKFCYINNKIKFTIQFFLENNFFFIRNKIGIIEEIEINDAMTIKQIKELIKNAVYEIDVHIEIPKIFNYYLHKNLLDI